MIVDLNLGDRHFAGNGVTQAHGPSAYLPGEDASLVLTITPVHAQLQNRAPVNRR
jgi:hypothetical protein